MIRHRLPDAPTGAPLYGAHEPWAVVVPEATTNLVPNPSFERGTTGYAPTEAEEEFAEPAIDRQAEAARRGAWGLWVRGGVALGITTDSGTHTWSVDLRGAAGRRYELRATAAIGGATLGARVVRGTGFWQRAALTATGAIGGLELRALEGGEFETDGWQLEAKAYATTYCDGDLRGYLRSRRDYLWTGSPHASPSTRSAITTSGGKIVRLKDLGWITLALLGLGLTGIEHAAVARAGHGGAIYQGSVEQPRTVTLVGALVADGAPQMERRRAALAAALWPRVGVDQPISLRYTPLGECGEATGEEMEIVASYAGGLEGSVEAPGQERTALTFTQWLPMVQVEGDRASALGMSQSVTGANYVLERDPDGVWDDLAGGTNNRVYAMLRGPDGRLYVGGDFTTAGGVAANGVARWDGSTWSALGSGTNSTVNALAFGPDGALYAAGIFTSPAARIARWDGSTWGALGAGTVGTINALAFGPDGALYAGGTFPTAGGVTVNNVAKWDGAAWSALGSGTNGAVQALAVGPDGSLYIGGDFGTAGGVTVNRIAKWDGSTWSALAGGMSTGVNNRVSALAFGPDGALYAGGTFTTAGGVAADNLAKWNGTGWAEVGGGVADGVTTVARVGSISFDKRGVMYVGGNFTRAGDTKSYGWARYVAGAWLPPDATPPSNAALFPRAQPGPAGELYMAFAGTGTATAAAVTTVTNAGSAPAAPRVEFVGPGTLVQLVNMRTGATIYFDELSLLAGERAVLELDPARVAFESDWRGNLMHTILPGSTLAGWALLPGENAVSLYMPNSSGAAAATMLWREGHLGLGGAVR